MTQEKSERSETDELAEMTEAVELIHQITAKQLRVVDALIHEFTKSNSDVFIALRLLLQAAGSSTNTIRYLTASPDLPVRESLMISRSVVETAINACFIGLSDESIAKRARQHALQKSYRDLNRKFDGKSQITLTAQVDVDPNDVPGLNEALALFTDKRGNEVRDWIDLDVRSRIKFVGHKSDHRDVVLLESSFFNIYRHSSEIIHGTVFGAIYFLQSPLAREFSSKSLSVRHRVLDQSFSALVSASFALAGAVSILSHEFDFPQIEKLNSAVLEEISNIPIIRKGLAHNSVD